MALALHMPSSHTGIQALHFSVLSPFINTNEVGDKNDDLQNQ